MKKLWLYILTMVLVMSLGLIIHALVLSKMGLPRFGNGLILTYTMNALLAMALLTALSLAPPKLRHSLGYLFLIGSLLKFALYFIVFYPEYAADGEVNKLEFLTFFIPYILALSLETGSLVRQLNRQK